METHGLEFKENIGFTSAGSTNGRSVVGCQRESVGMNGCKDDGRRILLDGWLAGGLADCLASCHALK